MPLAAPPRPRPRPLPEPLRTKASTRGRLASPATVLDGEGLSAVPVGVGELAAAAPATSGGLPRRRLAGGFPVASAAKARSDPDELLAAAAPDAAAAAAAAADRRGARGSPAAEPLPLPLPPSAAEVAFVSRSGTRSKMDLRKSNVSSACTVDLRWAGVRVLARREDATPAACVSKSCRSISSALPTWGSQDKEAEVTTQGEKNDNTKTGESRGTGPKDRATSTSVSINARARRSHLNTNVQSTGRPWHDKARRTAGRQERDGGRRPRHRHPIAIGAPALHHGRRKHTHPHTINVPGQAWRWLLCQHHRRPASSS